MALGWLRWKSVRRWIRPVHTYVTMAWMAMLLFFSLTGFVLHHGDGFGLDDTEETSAEGTLPAALCRNPDQEAIVGLLRERHGAKGGLRTFEADEDEIVVMFARPGRTTDVFIDRHEGSMSISTETGNAWLIMAEIHTGENAGLLGAWLIDLNAILLLFISLTGIVAWVASPGRRAWGIFWLFVGAVLFTAFFLALML